jgi:hypothetical protein
MQQIEGIHGVYPRSMVTNGLGWIGGQGNSLARSMPAAEREPEQRPPRGALRARGLPGAREHS